MAELHRARNTYWGDSIQEEKEEYDKGTALGEEGRGRGDDRHENGHDENQAHVEQHPGQPREKQGEKTEKWTNPQPRKQQNPALFNIPATAPKAERATKQGPPNKRAVVNIPGIVLGTHRLPGQPEMHNQVIHRYFFFFNLHN